MRPNGHDDRELAPAIDAIIGMPPEEVDLDPAATEQPPSPPPQREDATANTAASELRADSPAAEQPSATPRQDDGGGNGSATTEAPKVDSLEADRKLIEETLAKLKAEPEALFDDAVLKALAKVKREDPAAWGKIACVIRKKKSAASMKDLERAMTAVQTPEVQGIARDQKPAPRTAGEMLVDAPFPELLIPNGYAIDEHGTYAVKLPTDADAQFLMEITGEPAREKIAPSPIVLTEKLVDIDDGRQSLHLAWRTDGKWLDVVADRATVMVDRKIVELASYGFPAGSCNAKFVSRYLQVFEDCNSSTLPTIRTTRHLGWTGQPEKSGFLCGSSTLITETGEILNLRQDNPGTVRRNLVLFQGQTAGEKQVAAGFYTSGTLDGWLRAIERVKHHPRARLVVYVSLVPPLLKILRAPNFIIDFWGATSTGKSSLLQIAASVWGCPALDGSDSAIFTWDITAVGIERTAAAITDLPFNVDETKRAGDPDDIATALYAVAHGRGRGRGSKEGLQETRCFKTAMMMTGEQPATSYGQHGGTKTRCMELGGQAFGAKNEEMGKLVTEVIAGVQANFGHAGPVFMQHVIRNKKRWPEWRKLYSDSTRDYVGRSKSPEGGRMAAYAAAIDLAARIAHEALELPWDNQDPLDVLWDEITGEAAGADGRLDALQHCISWAHEHKDWFHGKAKPDRVPLQWAGRWEDGRDGKQERFIAFFQPMLDKILTEKVYSYKAILHGWREHGWIEVTKDDRQRFTKKIRPVEGEDSTHMIAINAKGLAAGGEGESEGESEVAHG